MKDPRQAARADLLIALAHVALGGQAQVFRVEFGDGEATIGREGDETRVTYSDHSVEDLTQVLGLRGAVDSRANFEGGEPWSDLLYDLGSNMTLLEAQEPGLRYVSVERLEGQARVRLERGLAQYEFLVALTDDLVALPETFHDWAHRYPGGSGEPIRI